MTEGQSTRLLDDLDVKKRALEEMPSRTAAAAQL
jgi:hypothetical protein